MVPSPYRAQFAGNIPRYFAYTALKGFGFGLVTAIWVIFLQRLHGLSLTQVTLVDVAFWLATALGEVPTGMVADTFGRKASLAIGAAIMSISIVAWALAPTVPLILIAYASLAIGITFLSGAEDAFLFESLQVLGRGPEYTRLVGKVAATSLAAVALGNLASGLLATVNLYLPFLITALGQAAILIIVLTFKEPRPEDHGRHARKPYGEVLRQSFALVRTRPSLRSAMIYLALASIAAVILETVFIQPQAVALGVPLAGVGVVVMVVQITNMAGSTWSYRIGNAVGESRVLVAAPGLIATGLLLLAALQVVPALLLVAGIGFVTTVVRPLVLSRIQQEAPDAVRATVLSLQSLLFTLIVAVAEPLLGWVADRRGLPAAYVGLAGGLSLLMLLLFWRSRRTFPSTPRRDAPPHPG